MSYEYARRKRPFCFVCRQQHISRTSFSEIEVSLKSSFVIGYEVPTSIHYELNDFYASAGICEFQLWLKSQIDLNEFSRVSF